MALSQAFSLIGYSGTAGAGVGSTEDTRWDNSVKYIFTYGPFHAAGMYTNGGQDTPMNGDGYGANAGVTYMGFSVDGFYTKENGAVNLSRVPLAANGVSAFTALFAGRSHSPNRLQRSLGELSELPPRYDHGQRSLGRDGEVHLQRAGLLLGASSQHEGCSLRRSEGCAMRAPDGQGNLLRRLSACRSI